MHWKNGCWILVVAAEIFIFSKLMSIPRETILVIMVAMDP